MATYTWATAGASGTFEVASDWVNVSSPGSGTFPGTGDVAYLIGLDSGAVQTIDGPADVASLNIFGLNYLTGAFTAGAVTVDKQLGAASLDLAGTLTVKTLGLIVGNSDNGSLDVESGGSLSVASTTGTSDLVLGNSGGSGTLTVLAGGSLSVNGPTQIINYGVVLGNTGTGDLIVSGASADVSDVSQDGLVAGYTSGGSGTLEVLDGGQATFATTNSNSLAAIGLGRGGNGNITVDGTGSVLTSNGGVYIGRGAAGVLVISNGGVFDESAAGTYFQIGDGASGSTSHIGGTGSATVESNGTLSVAGDLHVGGYGVNGSLTISTGGLVTSTVSSGTTGIGVGASGTISGNLVTGNGSIEVDAGGTLEAVGTATEGVAGLSIGQGLGTQATVTVNGGVIDAGNNDITVGSTGEGLLDVTDGGSVTAASPGAGYAGLILGNTSTGAGTLEVSGANATVNVNGVAVVGNSGAGALTIDGGGQVSATGFNIDVGPLSASAAVTVGAGGTLTTAGTIVVGGSAGLNGSFNVNGGVVDAAVVTLNSTAALSLDGGTLTATGSIFDSGTISGSGVINGPIYNGVVQVVGGTLTLTGVQNGDGLSLISTSDLVVGNVIGSTVAFGSVTGQTLDLTLPGSFGGVVSGFAQGDEIIAPGAQSVSLLGGNTYELLGAGNAPIGTLDFAAALGGLLLDNSGTLTVACFLEGSTLATPAGEVAVERLAAGDLVLTASGGAASVQWVGHRRIDCTRQTQPENVWPVRIRPHAFGPAQPARDLWLSPDHAVFVAGHLIPVRHLLNGSSIVQERRAAVAYFHVELARHDIVLAQGLPCESFLDTGNRAAFANGGTTVQLRPDFATRSWDGEACAPLAVRGPVLAAVRQVLARRAAPTEAARPVARARLG